ncbi:galactokinase [Clostridium cavendishii DSM 21758]|uniref:Galactokinase n=1 Tax=Clostridium cavendishii DSM 21758 TaxID=1121302 RepID=A0A1M6BNX4_9CLOT|nr:galactokinase [Clostridium cavendishii DSM 21758]
MLDVLKSDFKEIFKVNAENIFFAPGRVNLIGEHTDYNGGHVFPCALSFGTYAVSRKREDGLVRMYSLNFEDLGIIEFSINDLQNIKQDDWANYPKGVIWAFKEKGYSINHGMDVLVYGNIPNGAGLSSSASIELVTSVMLKDYFDLDLDMIEMVKLSQMAENKFIGVNCGIMDQFAIGMGKENHAILLDTNNLKYEYVPVSLDGASIVIANTNKRRGLADSKYNERRSECEEALSDIKEHKDINSLGDLTEEEFINLKQYIKRDVCRDRAEHAVLENIRTKKAVEVLKQGKISEFGELMKSSHYSLKDKYEVTGIELDTLVELALEERGVIGSRMTGAGFGGCTISLVKNENIEDFVKNVGKGYKEKIGYEASFYVASVGDGARKLF